MTRSIKSGVRRSLCVAVGVAGVAFAGAAAAQTYSYESQTPYSYSYQSPTYTYPSGSTYQYSYESSTSAPVYSEPSYSYPAPSYSYPATAYSYPADPYTGGITVYGRRIPRGDDHPEISRAVTYQDLDLTTDAGVDILRHRIARTARELCHQLGEPPAREQNTTVLPSCQAAARDTAYAQVQEAVNSARYWRGR